MTGSMEYDTANEDRVLRIGHRTHVGLHREQNEDSFFADPSRGIVIIADGMGGHRGGEVASALAADTAGSSILKMLTRSGPDANVEDILRDSIQIANERVFEAAREKPELEGMGTTIVVLVLNGNRAHVAHVGDSRCYLMRDGELRRLTEDHTVLADMVRRGEIEESQSGARFFGNQITRALGIRPSVKADMATLEGRCGDRFLLCSDGLTAMVTDDQIREILGPGHDDLQSTSDRLVELANDLGGHDNTTVAICSVCCPSRANGSTTMKTEDI